MNTCELELHQVEPRHEALRLRHPSKEGRILASLSEVGQQCPVVVIRDGERFVLIDGYKRLRGLRRLGLDLVQSTCWTLSEPDALVLERMLRAGEAPSPLEEAWLLRELSRLGLGEDELARRFDRSKSWVSRRLGLCEDLPEDIQALVRKGEIGAHAAMRHLLPLARANPAACIALAGAIAKLAVTSRQLGTLIATFQSGDQKTRDLVLASPALVLRAHKEAQRADSQESPSARLLADLDLLATTARRAHARLRKHAHALLPTQKQQLWLSAQAARGDLEALWRRLDMEANHDQSTDSDGHISAP